MSVDLLTNPLRIGTRGSPLALAQAGEVRERLMAAHGLGREAFAIVAIETRGDRIGERPPAGIGGKGLFTEAIEAQLLDGRIDIAVHSAKDVPAILPDGLCLATFPPRGDARDAFIGRGARRFADLPPGAVVGTAAPRRQALVRRLRPDLKVVALRGNVHTRLGKLDAGAVEGTFLAMAGLRRLGLEAEATETMDPAAFPPALGQGAIAIQARTADRTVAALLAPAGDAATTTALACERAFLAGLGGSCRTPVGGLARVEGDTLRFGAEALSADGTRHFAIARTGPAGQAAAIGQAASDALKAMAGPDFFEDHG